MILGDFPACTSPRSSSRADTCCWCTPILLHTANAAMDGVPLLANPSIPAWDTVLTREAFGGFAGVPPKTRAGHIALSPQAASLWLPGQL